jgi:WD40 repeat protein
MLGLFLATRGVSAQPAAKELPLRPKDIVCYPNYLVFSPDSRTLAVIAQQWVSDTGGYKHEITLFELAKAQAVQRLEPPAKTKPTVVLFSPDGSTLAAYTWGQPIILWDVGKGKTLCELEASECVNEAAFSADGKRLIARISRSDFRRHDNHVLAVWDIASGKKLRQIEAGSRGEIRAFSLAADGEHALIEHHRLAGVDSNGNPCVPWHVRVYIWNVKTGQELGLVGNVLSYNGQGDENEPPGHNLHTLGATCLGYSSKVVREMLGRQIIWPPWSGRLAFAQNGQALIFPDYKPYSPLLDTGNSILLSPFDEKPLLDSNFFHQGRSISAMALSPDGRKLATAEFDKGSTKLLLWDLSELARKLRDRQELSSDRLKSLWEALSTDGIKLAHPAMRVLAAEPAHTVSFLEERVKPIPARRISEKEISRWIADLDNDAFNVRETASRELAQLGGLAKPALEKARTTNPSAEMARRIGRLLHALDQPIPVEELRALRAVDVLEQIGTKEARRLLHSLASGVESASLTRNAKQALGRLEKGER